MEEITTRFEIIRLAVKMADHETIAVQAKKLRDISLDEDLNEIISLLESKNYRQALYLMKDYVNFLDDSFFNEPSVSPTPKKSKVQETTQQTQSLFDMTQSQASKIINLDDMLKMTEGSAGETVAHHASEHTAENYIAQAKEEVKKNEAYLDIQKNRVENKRVKPFEEPTEELLADMHGEVIDAKKEDIQLFKSPVGYPARGVKTQLHRDIEAGTAPKIACISNCVAPCNRGVEAKAVGYCIADRLSDAYDGIAKSGLFFTGANGYRLNEIITVKELMEKLINGEDYSE